MTRMANETKTAARAVSAPEQKVKDRILVVEDEDNARRGYELMLGAGANKGWGVPAGEKGWSGMPRFAPPRCRPASVLRGLMALRFWASWERNSNPSPRSSLQATAARSAKSKRSKPGPSGSSRNR